MATVIGVPVSRIVSPSVSSEGTLASPSASEVHTTPTHARQPGALGDVAYVSRASTLLSQVEQQLKKTPQAAVNQVLSSAATDILAQAQAENDPNQAKVLENLATRLQVAASSGSSALPPYSLSSLLGG
jgi:hypothetical protein